MSTEKLYHYTYIITNIVENKYYIGSRSSKVPPNKDLGIKYFSSSTDRAFIQDQKCNAVNYKYKVIAEFNSKLLALSLEIKLHSIHNVAANPNFYNRCKATSAGFDRTGVPASNKGKSPSSISRKKMSEARSGFKNYKAKAANVYDAVTHKLIAESVCLSNWAKENGYNWSHLSATARADRTKPHHYRNNLLYHKGVYARYIDSKSIFSTSLSMTT